MGTPFRLRGPVVSSFSQAELNTNRIMKRKLVRPYSEERTRNTHAVWLVTDASTGSMLIWTSLLTLTDLERGDRRGGHGARVGSTTNSNES